VTRLQKRIARVVGREQAANAARVFGRLTIVDSRTASASVKNQERTKLLETLQNRFEKHMQRHKGIAWADVRARLEANPAVLRSLSLMEATGGEPDVIGRDRETGECVFCDCASESPSGRRSVCYDREARTTRKEHAPKDSALELAEAMGVELLTEEQYKALQKLGEFDTKTSSWIKTPADVRKLGGALYGDRRYGRVFIYHNGAQSYYAARGFRVLLKV
jgi:hypothetical protein